jgi:hypothetical protein
VRAAVRPGFGEIELDAFPPLSVRSPRVDRSGRRADFGMEVQVFFEEFDDGLVLPQFRPVVSA